MLRIPVRPHGLLVSVAVGCALLGARVPQASTITQLDLAFTARKAGLIFAGTVDTVMYRMDPAGQTVLSLVSFKDVTYAKGDRRSGRVSLTLRGGRTDKDESRVIDQPEFEISKRYIVMTHADLGSEQNLYLPIIGLNAGFFPVLIDSTAKTTHVCDWEYRPIARIQGHHLVVVAVRAIGDRPAPPQRGTKREPPIEVLDPGKDPGTRVTETEFLRTVRTLGE